MSITVICNTFCEALSYNLGIKSAHFVKLVMARKVSGLFLWLTGCYPDVCDVKELFRISLL